MQGATIDAQFSALNATSATPPARNFANAKLNLNPRFLHQLVMRRKAIQTKGVNLNLTPQPLAQRVIINSRRQSTAWTLTQRAIFDYVANAKFKELLNFKVRRILRNFKIYRLKISRPSLNLTSRSDLILRDQTSGFKFRRPRRTLSRAVPRLRHFGA